MKNNLEKFLEGLEDVLPDEEHKIILMHEDHHSNQIEKAYVFKKEKKQPLNWMNRLYKEFAPISYHESFDTPILKIEQGMNIDYMPQLTAHIYQRNKDLEKKCEELGNKYKIQVRRDNTFSNQNRF